MRLLTINQVEGGQGWEGEDCVEEVSMAAVCAKNQQLTQHSSSTSCTASTSVYNR
jgi:hypothetical protein